MLDGHGLKLLGAGRHRAVILSGRDSPRCGRCIADLGLAQRATAPATSWLARPALLARRARIGRGGGDRRRLARPAAARARRLACAPPRRACRGAARAHHVTAAAAGRGARVLRPAARAPVAAMPSCCAAQRARSTPVSPHGRFPCRRPPRPPPELHLPDLPEVEVPLGAPLAGAAPAVRWGCGCATLLAAYLPLLLMALLAARHLVAGQVPPLAEGRRRAPGAPRARLQMRAFSAARFAPDGRFALRIEGDVLRHYPDTDRIEIDGARIHAVAPDGRVTRASAKRALANARRQRECTDRRRPRSSPTSGRRPARDRRRVPARLRAPRAPALAPAGAGAAQRRRDARRRPRLRPPAARVLRRRGARNLRPGERWPRRPRRPACAPAAGLHHRCVERHRTGAGAALRTPPAGA